MSGRPSSLCLVVGKAEVNLPLFPLLSGGHSGATIVPLLSQTAEAKGVDGEKYKALVNRIQFGGDEVVKAKDGAGSATLSMAYGTSRCPLLLHAIFGANGALVSTSSRRRFHQGPP